MLEGFKALLGSEKAIAAGVLVIAATIFVVVGKMTVAEWREFTVYILAIYTGGKTIQGAASAIAASKPTNGIGTSPSVAGIGTSPNVNVNVTNEAA